MRYFSKVTSIFALAVTAALGCAGCMTEVDEPTDGTEAAEAMPEEATESSSEALAAWGDDDECGRGERRGDNWYEYDCDDYRRGDRYDRWDDDDDWWWDSRNRRRHDDCNDSRYGRCSDDDWQRLRRHRNRHHDNGRRGRRGGDHW
jgi:hypothetical protein